MAPPSRAGAEWVDVRPLRRTHEPPGNPQPPAGLPRSRSSAAAGRPQARSPAPWRAL